MRTKLMLEIEQAAREAGKIILQARDIRDKVSEKTDFRNLVTEYDKKVQTFLFERLAEILPDAKFMGEENGADVFKEEYRNGWLFIVDPIDGTSNFICGLTPACTSIGLMKDGRPYLGVVYEPHLDLLYAGEKGQGAYLNGEPIESSRRPLAMSLVTFGTAPYYSRAVIRAAFDAAYAYMGRCIDVRRTGAAAFELCLVASGEIGMFLEPKIQVWDFAAGGVIAEEAGCVLTDFEGNTLTFEGPSSVVAASQGISKESYLPTVRFPVGGEDDPLEPETLLSILKQAAKLKVNTRHCWTEADRKESVADHSWRCALMAMLLSSVPEFDTYDCNKVIRMCLIHDLGESFTGDIPTFEKSDADADSEDQIFLNWVNGFPGASRREWLMLLTEMNALETREAKLYKALDKVEALISHNESDLSTWLPLEYELQMTYGQENMAFSEYMKAFRAAVDAWTLEKTGGRG